MASDSARPPSSKDGDRSAAPVRATERQPEQEAQCVEDRRQTDELSSLAAQVQGQLAAWQEGEARQH